MRGKRMINFMVGLLFAGIFCLNSGAFGALSDDRAGLSSEKEAGYTRMPSEVVFIDPSVRDAEIIVSQLPQGAEVVRLSPEMDGIAQISAHLAEKMNLSAIRTISHGNAGHFVLNGKRIDRDFLRDHGERIGAWGQALATNGDILLYACNLAATDEGKAFVKHLADLTGADVAASTGVTGGLPTTDHGPQTTDLNNLLLVSSMIKNADTLAEAANKNTIVINYTPDTSLSGLLEQIQNELSDNGYDSFDSIGIAAGADANIDGSVKMTGDETFTAD